MNLIYFILILIGLIGAGGTCGALQLDNITITHAMIQGTICLIVAFAGCAGMHLGGDLDDSEMY